MSTVKFGLQDELNELQARILLITKNRYSKQEILETIYLIGSRNLDEIITLLTTNNLNGSKEETYDYLEEWLKTPVDGKEETNSVIDHDVVQ